MSDDMMPKRWSVGNYDGYMVERDGGDYVEAEDVEPLAAEITRLRAENIHLRRAGMDRPSAELHEAALAELRDQISNLRAEVLEQARLLGMSGEREAKLLARVDLLREPLAVYVHAHETGNSVPPHIEAAARAALEAQP
jgi:hypothetical protein